MTARRRRTKVDFATHLLAVLSLGLFNNYQQGGGLPGQKQPAAYFDPEAVETSAAHALSVAVEAVLSDPVEKLLEHIHNYLEDRHRTITISGPEFDVTLPPGVKATRDWWVKHRKGEVTYQRGIYGPRASEITAAAHPLLQLDTTKFAGGMKLGPATLLMMFEDPESFIDAVASKAAESRQWIAQLKLIEAVMGTAGALSTRAARAMLQRKIPLASGIWAASNVAAAGPNTSAGSLARMMGDTPGDKLIASAIAEYEVSRRGGTPQDRKRLIRSNQALLTALRERLTERIRTSGSVPSASDFRRMLEHELSAMARSGRITLPSGFAELMRSDAFFNELVNYMHSSVATELGDLQVAPAKVHYAFRAASSAVGASDDPRLQQRARELEEENRDLQRFGQEYRKHPFESRHWTRWVPAAFLAYKFYKDYSKENAAALADPVEWFVTFIKGDGNFYRFSGVGLGWDGPKLDQFIASFAETAASAGFAAEVEYFRGNEVRDSDGNIKRTHLAGDPSSIPVMPHFLTRVGMFRWSYMAGALHPFQLVKGFINGDLPHTLLYIGTGFLDPTVLDFISRAYKSGAGLFSNPESMQQLLRLLQARFGRVQGAVMFRTFKWGMKLANSRRYQRYARFVSKIAPWIRWFTAPQMQAFQLYYKKLVVPVLKKVRAFFGRAATAVLGKGTVTAIKGTLTGMTAGLWLVYEAVNMLTKGKLDKFVFKTLYYSFVFVVFGSIVVLLAFFGPLYYVGTGFLSQTSVVPKYDELMVVPVGGMLENPDGYKAIGTPGCPYVKKPRNKQGTPPDDAICPLFGPFKFVQCGQGGYTHKGSGAVDVIPADPKTGRGAPSRYRLVSPVDGKIVYCNTAQNCICVAQGHGGGAVIIYAAGYYYTFLHIKPPDELCERVVLNGGVAPVKKGEVIAEAFYMKEDDCSGGPHLHFNITDEYNVPAYNGESCEFIVEKCGRPFLVTSDSACTGVCTP